MQDLPPVQPIDFVLSEDSTLEQIGSVHSIVEQIGRCVYAYTVYRPLSMQKNARLSPYNGRRFGRQISIVRNDSLGY